MHNTRNGELPGHHRHGDHTEPKGHASDLVRDEKEAKTAQQVVDDMVQQRGALPKKEAKKEGAKEGEAKEGAKEGEKKAEAAPAAEEKKAEAPAAEAEAKPAEEKKVQLADIEVDDRSLNDNDTEYGSFIASADPHPSAQEPQSIG